MGINAACDDMNAYQYDVDSERVKRNRAIFRLLTLAAFVRGSCSARSDFCLLDANAQYRSLEASQQLAG